MHINADGTPAAGNPNASSPVYTLGHRNVQGLAVQPGTGRVYSVEQGTSVDDEVNLLTPGGITVTARIGFPERTTNPCR